MREKPTAEIIDDILSRNGCEAIYWENMLVARVQITEVSITNHHILLKAAPLEAPGLHPVKEPWSAGGIWKYFHWNPKMWSFSYAISWRVLFDDGIVSDITGIAAASQNKDYNKDTFEILQRYLYLCLDGMGRRPILWPDAVTALVGENVPQT